MEQSNALVKIALNEVVQKVNSGVSPTEALQKVSSDLDLNPDYIHRVGEALNVALHYKHFKTASDRSEDFSIADIPAVVTGALTSNDKTAAEQADDSFTQGAGHDEVFNYNRLISNPRYKQAYLEIAGASTHEAHDSFPMSLKGALDKSAQLLRDLDQKLDNCHTEKVGAEIELNQTFSKLADHFRRAEHYRSSFAEFESQVFSKYAEQAVPFLDLLYKSSGLNEERGVHDRHYTMFDDSKEVGMFGKLMKAAEKLIETEDNLKTAEHNRNFEKEYYADIAKVIGKSAGHVFEDSSEDVSFKKKVAETSLKDKNAEVEIDPVLAQIEKSAGTKKANFLQTLALGRLVGGSDIASHGVESLIEDQFLKKKSPQFSGRANVTLDNMERQLLLQDLMMTDAILSKVPPAKVARAYEQILRLSPQVSKEKEVVRAMLRQAIASQAVAPHEADQWTRLDADILKRKMISDSYLHGRSDGVKF